MCLSACATEPRFRIAGPPPSLTADCAETRTRVDDAIAALVSRKPRVPGVTNGDLVRKIRQLRVDLKLCNADKAALRQWSAALTVNTQ